MLRRGLEIIITKQGATNGASAPVVEAEASGRDKEADTARGGGVMREGR